MTEDERLAGHGVCGRCKYNGFPSSIHPCRNCIWLFPDDRMDYWAPKEGDDDGLSGNSKAETK